MPRKKRKETIIAFLAGGILRFKGLKEFQKLANAQFDEYERCACSYMRSKGIEEDSTIWNHVIAKAREEAAQVLARRIPEIYTYTEKARVSPEAA